MKCNYFCFDENSEYYAIDTLRLVPLKLSKQLYEALYDLQCKKIEYLETLDGFTKPVWEELYVLSSQNILIHNDGITVRNTFNEMNLSFIPTLSCNLNCKYCYSKRKNDDVEMKLCTVKRTIDFFCENFDFSFCRVDFVSGGEPLYNKSALVKMIDTISNELSKNNKNTLFWLCSNGTLIDNDIITYLDKMRCNIGISLDGPKEINDSNRVFKNGKGTYDCVVRKIHQIHNAPDLSRNIKNLWNSAVITTNTKNLTEVLKNSYELGFNNLQMKLQWTSDSGLVDFEKTMISLYSDLTSYLFDLIKNDKFEQFLMICNENDTYGKMLLRIIIQSGVVRRCNAGINKFSISPEGLIYPCDSFMGLGEYCIGNIYDGFNDLYYEFKQIRNYNIDTCKTCWARNICGGDCMYNSYINSGVPYIPDEKICNVTKDIIKMCVKLIVDLFCCFPDRMQKIYNILAKKTVRMEPKYESTKKN